MSSLLKTLFPCLPLALEPAEGRIRLPTNHPTSSTYHPISEKPSLLPPPHITKKARKPTASEESAISETTSSIISALLSAPSPSPSLTLQIRSLVHQAGGWSEYLATKILSALEAVLKAGKDMNGAMQEAFEKACVAAECFEGFVKEHPVAVGVFCTVLALGVLAVLVPEVLAWLGFEEAGILEGELIVAFFLSFFFGFFDGCFVVVRDFFGEFEGLRFYADGGM